MTNYLAAPGGSFATIADLKAQAGVSGIAVSVNGGSVQNDGNGAVYMWNASSVATPDDFKIVQVTGQSIGRWERSINSNYTTGRSTFTGVLLQTAYVVNHNLGYIPSSVQTEAESAAAAVARWITNRTATSFTVNFAFLSSVPVTVNGLVITWVAYK